MVGAWAGLDNRPVGRAPVGDRQDRLRCASQCRGRRSSRLSAGRLSGGPEGKGRTVAAQGKGNASREAPNYLRAAEVAEMLYVSPKTVSRWAKEGRLPFMKTLGGHRRYPEAEIRELAQGLREEPTA
jgi:excisionase family DNA binding protein